MQIVRICAQICILWIFSFIGNWVVELTGIIIPGSIVGLVLLWLALTLKLINVKYVMDGANFLIAFLTLFFIPSTIGVINYPELLTIHGMLLVIAVFLSTVCTFLITAKISAWIEKKERRKEHA